MRENLIFEILFHRHNSSFFIQEQLSSELLNTFNGVSKVACGSFSLIAMLADVLLPLPPLDSDFSSNLWSLLKSALNDMVEFYDANTYYKVS